jgi:hypothetical protein
MKSLSYFASLVFAVTSLACNAGVDNDIPSCYTANKIPISPPTSRLEVFMMIDQTTQFDQNLKESIFQNFGNLLGTGNSFVISSFSSYAQGRYLEVQSAGVFEGTVAEKDRNDISMNAMRKFDTCLLQQVNYGRKVAGEAMQKAFSGSASDIAKSDIIGSLKELSKRVQASKAKDKIVFLASDMLENSTITSFYGNNSVRAIDPTAEMKKIDSAKMIGDFGAARVFVLGAGLMQEKPGNTSQKSGIYRDPKTVAALREFWDKYFTASNAKLIEFGAPALLTPVR